MRKLFSGLGGRRSEETEPQPQPQPQPQPEQITPPKVRLLYNYDIEGTFIYGVKAFLPTPSERKKYFLEQYKSVNSGEIEKLRKKMIKSRFRELFYIWLSISLDILYTDWPGKEDKYKSLPRLEDLTLGKEYNDFEYELTPLHDIISVLRDGYRDKDPETYYTTEGDKEDTEKQARFKNAIERKFGIEIILFEGDNIFSLDFYLPKDEGEKNTTLFEGRYSDNQLIARGLNFDLTSIS